ncbi:hypothetical protein [Actinomadura sediminis]|uniref:Carboxypeptidase regulatory-like domain-containing protein n=1 Tax=Actinomadura sediminis TaxID=1038904 RepID=A0ABW3ENY5_9ACTN
MRRTKLSAVLVALIMAASALLIPGTAHADATDVSLSVEFDNLSPDRTATVTLKAKSESGVTNVEAVLRHRRLPDVDATIGSLPFTLVDGTVNDGTWKAEYEVDIEAHPGFIVFDVTVTTADGATLTRSARADSCYEGRFADLKTSPAIVDPDERGIVVQGRLLVQKVRGAEPEPAPEGITVRGIGDASATTAADGSFTLSIPSTATRIYVSAGQAVCQLVGDAPDGDFSQKATEISASIVTPQPVEAGAEVTVEGVVRREGAGGFEPVGNMTVSGYTAYSTDAETRVGGVDSAEDGTFAFTFTAQASGPVVVRTEDTSFLATSLATAGRLTVTGAPEISAFSASVQQDTPSTGEDTVVATGRLLNGDAPIEGERVYLESASEKELFWHVAATGVTAEDGSFSLRAGADRDLQWRVRSAGSADHAATVSVAEHVDVRDRTVAHVTAESTADGVVTLGGRVRNAGGDAGPVSSRPVHVYFQPEGESTWEYRGTVTTDADGAFTGRFTEHRDGGWTVWFWGDDEFLRTNAPVSWVDIRPDFETKFSRFGASPTPVTAGKPVTVNGVLSRFKGTGALAPAPNLEVYVYFMPKGSSEWKQVGMTRTGADGSFAKAFTAERDGYWTAWFWGDKDHVKANSATAYVDVR